MKLYLDTCFLNRPFDGQSVDRVRLETEALKVVMGRVDSGEWALIGSSVLDMEIARMGDKDRREAIEEIVARAVSIRVSTNDSVTALAREIQAKGVSGFDALHLACASFGGANVFLTTDDRLVRRAARIVDLITMNVALPLDWLWRKENYGGGR